MGWTDWTEVVADQDGPVVGGDEHQVKVYNEETDVEATLKMDSAGSIALAQPLRPFPGTIETDVRIQPLTTDTLLQVDSTTGFKAGDYIAIISGATQKHFIIRAVTDADTLELAEQVGFAFPVDSKVGGMATYGMWKAYVEDARNYTWKAKNTATGVESGRNPIKVKILAATIDVQEEGALVGTRAKVNFIGPDVTAVDNPGAARVDVTVKGSPTGSMIVWLTDTAPTEWLLAYGQAVSRTTYAALFAVISTVFGAGDASTTFNLPDTRGRVLVGQDDMGGVAANRVTAANAIGVVGGAATHTLATSEIPSHAHSHNHGSHYHQGYWRDSSSGTAADHSFIQYVEHLGLNHAVGQAAATDGGVSFNHQMIRPTTPTTDATTAGSGAAHNIVQPYITVNWIIRT